MVVKLIDEIYKWKNNIIATNTNPGIHNKTNIIASANTLYYLAIIVIHIPIVLIIATNNEIKKIKKYL